jgi:hypothetical protein
MDDYRARLLDSHPATIVADNGEARLHHVAAPIGQLPLGEERAIIELKARGLLGDVDLDRSSREYGGYRERKLAGEH